MNNNVEILRSICFTSEDMETIKNLGDLFSKKEIEFMVEFKKIYELGTDQLEKFINKLDEEGKDLDIYTIKYYIEVLLNGPLGNKTRELSKDKKYFIDMPDSLGTLGNVTRTYQNCPIYPDMDYPLGCSVDVYNRIPKFSQTMLTDSIKKTENMFMSSLYSSTFIDNTLPIIDKKNSEKYESEKRGDWQKKPSGTYLNRDITFFNATKKASEEIFKKVKEYLGDENYRMFYEIKSYSPFDSRKNESEATVIKIKKEYINPLDSTKKEEITTDVLGDEFDSEKRRKNVLKIQGVEVDQEFTVNTTTGQLGN